MNRVSISQAWQETRGILSRNGSLLATVALALFVLPGVISDLAAPQAPPPGQMGPFGYWNIVAAIAILIALVGQLSVIRLALGPETTVGEAIKHGARRALPYIAATLLWILPFALLVAIVTGLLVADPQNPPIAAVILIILLLIAMIFVAMRMLMTSPVAAAEPGGPIHILKRSWELTQGNWWRLFGFFILFLIAAVILMIAIGTVIGVIVGLLLGAIEPRTVGALIVSLVNQVVGAAATVIFMVMLARIYLQLSTSAVEPSVPSTGT